DKNYPIFCRKHGSMDANEEILLDMNFVACDKEFTSLGAMSVSPDHKLLAYAVDFLGDEKYTIKILDIAKKSHLESNAIKRGVILD
ncbi:MAG: hypothetical protein V4485_04365, partial [Pseudomonadota bacterium]